MYLLINKQEYPFENRVKVGNQNSCAIRIDRIPAGQNFRGGPKKVFFTIEKLGRKFVLKTALFTPVVVNRKKYVFGRGEIKDGDSIRLHNTSLTFIFKESPRQGIPLVEEREECPVCFETPVNTQLQPCEHLFCERCVRKIRTIGNRLCPLCRANIQNTSSI